MFIEVLTEGASDVPVIREVLTRRFALAEGGDFVIHPHQGRGQLPANPLARPEPKRRGLLDQLPAKLRAYGGWMKDDHLVLVLLDTDSDDCKNLLLSLTTMLKNLPRKPPRVLFRLAIEETESWFIADTEAVRKAFKGADLSIIRAVKPDAIVGAWEKLAQCIGEPVSASPPQKERWAQTIAPHLNLENPRSPSFRKLLDGLARELQTA